MTTTKEKTKTLDSKSQIYAIPEEDAKRLYEYFKKENLAGRDPEGWWYWFGSFIGAPTSIEAIDDFYVSCKVNEERERCAKIAEGFDYLNLPNGATVHLQALAKYERAEIARLIRESK